MNKKKVLFILNEPLEKAGAQTVIMSIVKSLSNEYSFDIILFNDVIGFYDNEFVKFGGSIYRFPNKIFKLKIINRISNYYRGYYQRHFIKKIINTNKYDIIHCHNGLDAWHALKLAKRNNINIRISHCHSILSNNENILRRVKNNFEKKRINKYATKTISCSSASRDSMYINDDKNLVIGNAYDNKKFIYHRLEDSKDIKLVQVGYYSSNKNQLFSINVLKEIVKKYSNSKLYLIGFENEKGYKDILLNEVKENNLIENVLFFEQDSDISKIMKDCNYLIMPSIKEAFGIVLLEAQAVGLKCFVSNSVPIDANVGGYLYFDLKDGSIKCAEMIINDFNETNGKHIELDCQKFSYDTIADLYKKVYEKK